MLNHPYVDRYVAFHARSSVRCVLQLAPTPSLVLHVFAGMDPRDGLAVCMGEIIRALQPGGYFISVSDVAHPDSLEVSCRGIPVDIQFKDAADDMSPVSMLITWSLCSEPVQEFLYTEHRMTCWPHAQVREFLYPETLAAIYSAGGEMEWVSDPSFFIREGDDESIFGSHSTCVHIRSASDKVLAQDTTCVRAFVRAYVGAHVSVLVRPCVRVSA